MRGKTTPIKVGDILNECTLLRFAPSKGSSRCKRGVFLCKCGKEFETALVNVKSGKSRSCGCYNKEVNRDRAIVYEVGQKIGTLIYISESFKSPSGDRNANFQCVCGKIFITRIDSAKSGTTKSCGCLTSKLLSEAGKKRNNLQLRKSVECVKHQEIPFLNEKDIERFWNKVAITANPDKCWNWMGSSRRRGYGRFSVTISTNKNVSVTATRISYLINSGIQPLDKCVLHSCDNPSCVNPNHLSLGTYKDNTDDMMNKGRHRNQFNYSLLNNYK